MPEQAVTAFTFPYSVEYIRKRGRKTQRAVIAGRGFVCLQRATVNEVSAAFEIHRRDIDLTFRVLRYSERLWWPVINAQGPLRGDAFLYGLSVGDADHTELLYAKSMPRTYWLQTKFDEIDVRIVTNTTQDEMLVAAQKGADRLMIIGDFLYILGEEPIYICDHKPAASRPLYNTIHVADQISRKPNRLWGFRSAGFGSNNLIAKRIREAAVFRADELNDAKILVAANGGPTSPPHDTIVQIDAERVHASPLDLHAEMEVRDLDWRLTHIAFRPCAADKTLASVLSTIKNLVAQNTISLDAGASALQTFIEWVQQAPAIYRAEYNSPYVGAVEAFENLNAHCAQRRVKPPRLNTIDPDDEAALADLAQS
jgi:hypothetical protein